MNPFYITGIVPEPFFCDREKETRWLVQTLENKANVLLTSPRRMGKTQLIRHVYAQPSIKDNYFTFYIDIYPTTSLQELVLFMGKEIYSSLVPKGKTFMDRFLSCLRSLTGSFSYDPASGLPAFNVKLGDVQSPELTLQEIFNYLEQAGKPCIFAIDEFQQIARYPEKNVEALLRSYVQQMSNCQFIYAGSNRHILENMFLSPAKPFYNSAEQMYLDRIPKDVYVDFAIRRFRDAGRTLTPEAANLAYDLFEGHTYYVHNLLHNAFAYLDPHAAVCEQDILKTLSDLLDEKDHAFSAIMNRINYQQKETIVAIAKEGKAVGVTSVAFVKRHALKSPSSVQYAISSLLDAQLLTYETAGRVKIFSVADRFFEKWIIQKY
ncbi:MAG: ATP-binding protein [Bacteroidales bacterium]|nr:ATP-binding protein [Bacteroidales bacterium]